MSTSCADSTRFLTNREFSDQEKTYIQSLLLQTIDELRDVDEQIAQLANREITRLTSRKAELASHIYHYEVALAPHKMLPEYILQLIFRWCIPLVGLRVPVCRGDTRLSFTQVCSSWRKIAMNMPELWRDVRVRFDPGRYNRCKIDLAHMWLSRAGDMPRSLDIKVAYPRGDPDSEALGRLLVPFRFRSLDLTLTRGLIQRVLSLPLQTQSLHSLRLKVEQTSIPQAVYEDCSAYNLITTLPWNRLRHLRIDSASISTSTSINILSNCLVLEDLWMILCPDPAPCDAPASSITLPNLRQLTLYFVTGSDPRIFFRLLILPQVEMLHMSMTNFGTEMPGCTSLHFANMAKRSGMSQILDLSLGKGIEPYQLVDLLKYTPSLSSLQVGGDVVFDNQTLEDMSTGQLGPNMTALYLPEVEDSLRILEMVRTRFQNAGRGKKTGVSVIPIMEVEVSEPSPLEFVEVREWIDKLLDLRIVCYYDGYVRW